ncbi:hypothetical protein ACETU7_21430 [Rhodococcus sp. 3Y1]
MGAVAVPLLTTLFGYVPTPAFGGPGARTLMRQWARTVITGNPPYKADRPIATPALVISFASDAMAPPRSVDIFAEKLFETRAVTRWQYEHDDVLPGASNDHVRWVRKFTGGRTHRCLVGEAMTVASDTREHRSIDDPTGNMFRS